MNKELVFKGKVTSGRKRGKYFVSLPWVKKQIKTKLGFDLYPGTLNLRVINVTDINELHEANGIEIKPEKGYFKGKCFKAQIMNEINGGIVLPSIPEYPSDMLEVLAPINLRRTLGLKDGEIIEVIVRIE